MDHLWESGRGRLSTQVLNEYYVTVTGELSNTLPVEQARADVRDLTAWKPVPVGADLLDRAWEISDRFGLSHWDALVAAAARQLGCRWLLTEDLQGDQDLWGLTVVDPFATSALSLPDAAGR